MDIGFSTLLMRSAVMQILMISAPILLIGMEGWEQTLSFVPKILAILLSLVFFGPWMFNSMREFTINLFLRIPDMVK